MTKGKKESKALDISLSEPQAAFLQLDCRYPLFTGGVGSGKSHTMIVSAFIDATHSPNATIAIYEPTFNHIRTIALPKMCDFLTSNNIDFKYNKNEHYMEIESKQIGNFIFMSYDNPELIVGFESYRSHIDELDVVNEEHARSAWNKIIARNRQNPKGLPDKYKKLNAVTGKLEADNRVSVYSTPEGYKFTHKMWSMSTNPEYQYVKAATRSNPTISESYVQSLIDTYPKNLVSAYLEGEWVNMASGSVYNNYNRTTHASNEAIRPGETLYIGCDFNVTKQAATVYVKREGGHQLHAVEELTDMYDTPEMIRIITDRWQSKGHHIVMYPDASGNARKTTNASVSDISLLRNARFEVRARSKNPDVRDRIQATNKAFADGRIFVNANKCPTVARCFEQQAYNKNGEPDKGGGFDHQNDASTYPISYEMSVVRPIHRLDVSFASRF